MNSTPTQLTFPWAYLPSDRAKCTRTGFSRATIYRLLKRAGGEIRTVQLKEPEATRGRRLVDVSSLLAYLDRLAAAQRQEEGTK